MSRHQNHQLIELGIAKRGLVIRDATTFLYDGWRCMDVACVDGFAVAPSSLRDPVELSVRGLHIVPSIVDPHTHLGLCRYGQQFSIEEFWGIPSTERGVLGAISLTDLGFSLAFESGIGSLVVDPPSSDVVGGTGWLVHCCPNGGRIAHRAGTKCALGESVLRFRRKQGRQDRPGALWSEMYQELEAMRLPRLSQIRVHAYRWRDIHAACMIARDLDLVPIPLHAAEAIQAIDRGAIFNAAILGPVRVFPFSDDAMRVDVAEMAHLFSWDDIQVSLTSDAPVRHPADLVDDARYLVAGGVPEEKALRAMTYHPRQLLGLSDGISPGSRLDCLILSGHPFEYGTESVMHVHGRRCWCTPRLEHLLDSSPTFVPLELCREELLGGKARGLRRILKDGFPVPATEVVPIQAIEGDGQWRSEAQNTCFPSARSRLVVRSDTVIEDADQVSCAGRFTSVLGITNRSKLVRAIEIVSSDMRRIAGKGGTVLIQDEVDAYASGCALFQRTADGSVEALIECVPGLGVDLMQGISTPEHVIHWDDGVGFCMDAEELPCDVLHALELVTEYGRRAIASHHHAIGLDIEWAVAHDGKVALLQCRPLTAAVDMSAKARPVFSQPSPAGVWCGRGLSPGVYRGYPTTDKSLSTGRILVQEVVLPEDIYSVLDVAGLVTEHGGATSHVAIVCRERGIPYVSGISVTSLDVSTELCVDGNRGIVSRSDVEVPRTSRRDDMHCTCWRSVSSDMLRQRLFSNPWRELRRASSVYLGWSAPIEHWPSRYFDPCCVEYSCAPALAQALLGRPATGIGERLATIKSSDDLAYLLPLVVVGAKLLGETTRLNELVASIASYGLSMIETPALMTADAEIRREDGGLAMKALAMAGEVVDWANLGLQSRGQRVCFERAPGDGWTVTVSLSPGSASAWLPDYFDGILGLDLVVSMSFPTSSVAGPTPLVGRKKYPLLFNEPLTCCAERVGVAIGGLAVPRHRIEELVESLRASHVALMELVRAMSSSDLERAYARVLCEPLTEVTEVPVQDRVGAGYAQAIGHLLADVMDTRH